MKGNNTVHHLLFLLQRFSFTSIMSFRNSVLYYKNVLVKDWLNISRGGDNTIKRYYRLVSQYTKISFFTIFNLFLLDRLISFEWYYKTKACFHFTLLSRANKNSSTRFCFGIIVSCCRPKMCLCLDMNRKMVWTKVSEFESFENLCTFW